MSNMRDGPVLKAVAEVVKDQIGKAFASLRGRIDDIESQIKSLPAPEKGEKGDKGDPGIGEPGPIGPVGPAGKDGIGIVGEAGQPGLNGKDGAPGRDGKDGAPGNPGEKGIDGAPGRDGKDGAQGAKGLDGINGKDGKDGSNGIDGKDAPAVDIKALSEAITEKVLGAIPKPKDGLDGKDGASVDPEAVRILVAAEVTKAVAGLPPPKAGRDGRDGRAGDAGLPGRDALDIDILEGIDESASYQRGTYAHHRGGTLKAYRTTDPIQGKDFQAAGWQVIQEGIADAGSALAADEQTVVQSLELTSGKLLVSKFEIPTLIHKGIWKSDQEYKRGHFVTTAGSTWHCNELTKDRPGVSKAWTLVVKRGSDGKDATLNGAHQ